MKPRNSNSLSVVLSLLMLAGIVVLLFLLLRWLVESISTLQSETSAAIIAAAATISVAAMGHTIQATLNRRSEIEAAQRPAKIELYESFIQNSFKLMNIGGGEDPKPLSTKEQAKVAETQIQITQKMLLWGSDEVIQSYERWWKIAQQLKNEDEPSEFVARFEDILFALRRDLGHKNKKLERKHLLSMFLKDIEEIDLSDYPLKKSASENRKS